MPLESALFLRAWDVDVFLEVTWPVIAADLKTNSASLNGKGEAEASPCSKGISWLPTQLHRCTCSESAD